MLHHHCRGYVELSSLHSLSSKYVSITLSSSGWPAGFAKMTPIFHAWCIIKLPFAKAALAANGEEWNCHFHAFWNNKVCLANALQCTQLRHEVLLVMEYCPSFVHKSRVGLWLKTWIATLIDYLRKRVDLLFSKYETPSRAYLGSNKVSRHLRMARMFKTRKNIMLG